MLRKLLVLISLSAIAGMDWSRAQQPLLPPLPDEEGPATPDEAFSILPGPGEIPPESPAPGDGNLLDPPIPEEPQQPMPADAATDQYPDLEPLGLPSDGEPMPEFPDLPPGLVLPKHRPAAPPAGDGAVPVPDLLPPPDFQLAKKSRWLASPIEARRISREQKKPLLIFFAQRWDGPCPSVLLNNDLFTQDDFNQFASARLILTKLVYPVGSPGRSYTEAKLKKLDEAKAYFKVTGFPTLILIDENGKELERVKGYRRVSDPVSGQEYSSAHVILDRLKEAEHRHSEKKRFVQERIDNLLSQGYRVWRSRHGSSLMAKLVEAKPKEIILKDENGRWWKALPEQLMLYDAEWARRKQAGLIPPPAPAAASGDSGTGGLTRQP